MDKQKLFSKFLETNKGFSDNEKMCGRNSQICIFLKGLVHGFCHKREDFSIFCFMQNGSSKRVLRSF